MTSLDALQTPEQDSGWIEHDGKRRPINRDESVVVTLRGGKPCKVAVSAGDLDWVHRGDSADIVAYRLHKPSPSSQGEEH